MNLPSVKILTQIKDCTRKDALKIRAILACKNVDVVTEETKVKVGDVVGVRSGRGTINAFVFRTFTNGEFRAIPETHKMYRDVLG